MPYYKFMLKKITLSISILCISSIASFAQMIFIFGDKLPGYLTNYEVGYSYSFTSVTQTQVFTLADGSKKEIKSSDVQSLMSPGVYMGWSLRLKKLGRGEQSALGLNVGMQENMFMWSHTSKIHREINPSFPSSDENFMDEKTVGASMQIGVPISLDIKFGHDAFKYRNIRWGGSLGVGVMPNMIFSAGIPNFDSESFNGNITPFIKGDISIFAGIAIKLRGQIGFATTLGDSKNSLFGGQAGGIGESTTVKHEYKVQSPIQATFSIVLMPFSWGWEEKGFWNTYYYK